MENIIHLGATGFIGTNLTLWLAKNNANRISVVDIKKEYFSNLIKAGLSNIRIIESPISLDTDFETLLEGKQVVYHLVSTTVPTISNQKIAQELTSNVVMTAKLLDACVK